MTAKKDISVILFIGPEANILEENGSAAAQLEEMFHEVYWLIPSDTNGKWTQQLSGSKYLEYNKSAAGKLEALNLAASECTGGWLFYLEPDERCNWHQLVSLSLPPDKQTAYAVGLANAGSGMPKKINYQIRLFPNPKKKTHIFRGSALPDIHPTFLNEGWELDFLSFEIEKEQSIYEEAFDELKNSAAEAKDPLSLLACGILEADREDFKQACSYFLKALESDGLFLFDELAAYNSLGEVLSEQGRWFEAKRYVQKSIDKCPDQRAAYLLMYKINSYIHEWNGAYECLSLYEQHARQPTRANLDVHLPEGELKLLKGEVLFKLNEIEQAFHYYGQFYEEREGKINPVIIERLLIYAIETDDFERAKHYLGSLFNPYLPDMLDSVMEVKLHETLTLFMENGWHDFVFNLYERLYNARKNKDLLLRWTATLVKAGRVDKARRLIAAEGNQFNVWAEKA